MSLIEPIPLQILGWLSRHRRKIIVALLILLALISLLWLRACMRPTPHLDEEQIQRGEEAVRQRNDARLREILTNSDVRAAEINANVVGASVEVYNATQESKRRWANANIDELREEFERRKNAR